MRRNKAGISAIVATVLMILIIVAAVGIIYSVILPMFGDLKEFNYEDLNLGIALEGYTVYDSDTGYVFVQVRRGSDDLELVGLELIFEIEGESIVYAVGKDDVPQPNGKAMYQRNLRAAGYGAPTSVSVVPLIKKNDGFVRGVVSSKVVVPSNKVQLSDVEWDRIIQETKNEYPKGYYDDWTPVTGCSLLDVENGKYYLEGNIEVTSSGDFNPRGHCLSLVASGIEFDLRGNTVLYSGSALGYNEISGIEVSSSNIVLKNGRVNGFNNGIYLVSVQDSKLEDLFIDFGELSGVKLVSSSGNNLSSMDIFKISGSGGKGIYLDESSNNNFNNFNISECLNIGVYLEESTSNIFHDFDNGPNDYHGVSISFSSNNNQFFNFRTHSNYRNGFMISQSDLNHFEDVESSFNSNSGGNGFYISRSSGNVFRRVNVSHNFLAFRLAMTGNMHFYDSYVCDNSYVDGIYITGGGVILGSGNFIQGNPDRTSVSVYSACP